MYHMQLGIVKPALHPRGSSISRFQCTGKRPCKDVNAGRQPFYVQQTSHTVYDIHGNSYDEPYLVGLSIQGR